jgi:hypothetical protein
MRKLIIAGMAVAMLAVIPAAASASTGVERCQVTTTVAGPSVTTATFKVIEPRGSKDDFSSFWTSSYEVTVTGSTFEGTGTLTDGADINVPLTIKGTFNSDDTISYVAAPADTDSPVRWVLENGKTDGTVNPASTLNVEGPSVATNVKVTQPVPTVTPGVPTTTTTEYKNHGEYVSSLGGGKVAAQACIGMPTVSTQGIASTLAKK